MTTTNTPQNTYTRSNPYYATMVENKRLTKPSSAKDTRHIVLDITNSGLTYNIGDSLGVFAANRPHLADELIQHFHWNPLQHIPATNHTLRETLLNTYTLNRASKKFVKLIASKLPESNEQDNLLNLINNQQDLDEYVYTRDYYDILKEYPATPKLTPEEFIDTLVKTTPRLYSIASAQSQHPNHIHLTVAVVNYTTHGRSKYGLASGCLADLIPIGGQVPVYVQPTRHFHLPQNTDTDIIMVGPGTGIAPFRAFLQHRQHQNAKGRNWLFFGDQHQATDYLYQDEFQSHLQSGLLTHIHTAFSRDQQHKIYVQDRLRENGSEIWQWLQNGAYFYICGDAKRMAKDVNQTLIQIAQQHGHLTPEAATEYINTTLPKTEHRYLKDIY